MSVNIDTVTISAIEDRRLELGNAQAARVIDIGTSWTRLRVGCRIAFDDSGANITGTPRLYLGVMASPSVGMANGPLGATTSHFVGLIFGNATLTRNAGPPAYYSGITGATNIMGKKVGAAISFAAANVTMNLSAAPATNRCVMIAEITKGAPNFTLQALSNSATAVNDITLARFLSAMEIDTMAGVEAYLDQFAAHGLVAPGSLAVSEGVDGFLNAVCVAWDRSTPLVHISDMMYAKMA
jgi:hypothetical protein